MPLPWLMVYVFLLFFYFFIFMYINYLGGLQNTSIGVVNKEVKVTGVFVSW